MAQQGLGKTLSMLEMKCAGCEPELRVDLAAYGDRVTPGRANQITLTRVNTPTRNILRKFDNNGDGRIDASEIQTIVTTLVAEKFKSKAFKIGLIILAIFTAVLLGAMFGLTWAVVAALKDTQVQGNVLVTNDKSQSPVLVANMDLTVSGTKLVSRNSSSILTTSTVQTPGAISAKTPFEKLVALQNLVLVTPSSARYSLAILGIARIPSNTSSDGYIVRVLTAAGTLTLEDGVWSVSNMTGPMLEGFFTKPAGPGRRLAEDKVYFYFICEDGECGDAIPCGLPGLAECPISKFAVGDSGQDDTAGDAVNSPDDATAYGTIGCTYYTPYVTTCMEGAYYCYGSKPLQTQLSKYLLQPFCPPNCSTWFLNWAGDCEGTKATARKFCCP